MLTRRGCVSCGARSVADANWQHRHGCCWDVQPKKVSFDCGVERAIVVTWSEEGDQLLLRQVGIPGDAARVASCA